MEGELILIDLHRAACEAKSPHACAFTSMMALIEAGDEALKAAKALLSDASDDCRIGLAEVKLLAPLPRPAQVRDFMAFEKHFAQAIRSSIHLRAQAEGKDPEHYLKQAEDMGMAKIPPVWYERPIYYKANRFAVCGQDETVEWPANSTLRDYECELACVIGKGGKDIPTAAASDHIFGFMIFNDLTARDIQAKDLQGMMGPSKGKDFDNANPMGPYLVTRDEVGDPYALDMVVRVNGIEVSRGNSRTIHWTFEQMIEFVSQNETLYPGEVFGSGTVGDGCGFEHLRFLDAGDAIELEIAGLGTLRTSVKA